MSTNHHSEFKSIFVLILGVKLDSSELVKVVITGGHS